MDNVYAVLMAGGSGIRFWPMSRKLRPKQCLAITGNNPMVVETKLRLAKLVPDTRIFISTREELYKPLKTLLPSVRRFILEPEAKDTAAALGLACAYIGKKDTEAVIVALPSDHDIKPARKFVATLKRAIQTARQGYLVTVGIPPSRPETGYGYIAPGKALGKGAAKVAKFVEKPDLDRCKGYLRQGYLWNGGILVFRYDSMMEAFAKFMPKLHKGILAIQQSIDTRSEGKTLERVFSSLKKISIDYGVLEKAQNVAVVRADFSWDDVGGWAAMERILPKDGKGNASKGTITGLESSGNIVVTDKKVAMVGIRDLVVVETKDAILICPKSRLGEMKKLHKRLPSKYT